MNFYQVNQKKTFDREFTNEYLCSPIGSWGGWPLMPGLQAGDILFHYNSRAGVVVGISRVAKIGKHKGLLPQVAHVLRGTQCIQYSGRHLSEADFNSIERQHYGQKYPSYFEVRTQRLRRANLGKLLKRSPQTYLVKLSAHEAQSFLNHSQIRLDSLKSQS
jgi:hypothetical protein